MKKAKNNQRLLFSLFGGIGAILIVAVLSYLLVFEGSPPRGWVKREPLPEYYSLYTPSDWRVDESTSYWQALEPEDGNFAISFGGTSPLVSSKEGAGTYRSLWVAKLNQQGNVASVQKSPLCTTEGEIISIAGGYYRCGGSDYKAIAVAFDVTDFVKEKENYDKIEGRLYDASDITCLQQKSTKYELEKTCDQIVKTFQKIQEF